MMEAKKICCSPLANSLCFDTAVSSLLRTVTGGNAAPEHEALFGDTSMFAGSPISGAGGGEMIPPEE